MLEPLRGGRGPARELGYAGVDVTRSPVDFDFSAEEHAFVAELESFLEAESSPDVMDPAPEQLSQTVDTPAKRAFMRKLAARGWLGMSWPPSTSSTGTS